MSARRWCRECRLDFYGYRYLAHDLADLGERPGYEQEHLAWVGLRAIAHALGFCGVQCVENGIVGRLVALRMMGVLHA